MVPRPLPVVSQPVDAGVDLVANPRLAGEALGQADEDLRVAAADRHARQPALDDGCGAGLVGTRLAPPGEVASDEHLNPAA